MYVTKYSLEMIAATVRAMPANVATVRVEGLGDIYVSKTKNLESGYAHLVDIKIDDVNYAIFRRLRAE